MRLIPFEYAVRNLGRSPRRLVAMLLGSTLLIGLLLAAAAFVRGMNRGLSAGGSTGNVIILGAGSEESLERSEIPASVADLLRAAVPGLRTRLGQAYVSPEVVMALVVRLRRDAPAELQAVLRGATPTALLVHDRVQMIAGRPPETARDEVMVGVLAATRLGVSEAELAVGRQIWFADRAWTISGRFAAPGSVMESEIWFPLADLMTATKRTTLSCVVATLGQAEFDDVDAFCKQRLDLEIVALPEAEYYARLRDFFGPIRTMVIVTAGLVALGGLFGGLNTLYAAFASRIRELATLQTLGFSRLAILVSLLQEGILTTAAGALLSTLLATLLLDGLAVRFSMGAFGLVVDGPVVAVGLASGLLLGAIGALPPAWRCLRVPVKDALRAV